MFILLEDHIDIHQPKDQKKNYMNNMNKYMNNKKQQLGEDIQQLSRVSN